MGDPLVTGFEKGSREMMQVKLIGYTATVDVDLGHLIVEHDGQITWDELQAIKNAVWGNEVRAIEVYPAQSQLVNGAQCRHLWRLGENDFCPDLLGDDNGHDGLQARHARAWAEAQS